MKTIAVLALRAVMTVASTAAAMVNLLTVPLLASTYGLTLFAGYVYSGWAGLIFAALAPGISSGLFVVLLWIRAGEAPWLLIAAIAAPFLGQFVAGCFGWLAAATAEALEHFDEWAANALFRSLPLLLVGCVAIYRLKGRHVIFRWLSYAMAVWFLSWVPLALFLIYRKACKFCAYALTRLKLQVSSTISPKHPEPPISPLSTS